MDKDPNASLNIRILGLRGRAYERKQISEVGTSGLQAKEEVMLKLKNISGWAHAPKSSDHFISSDNLFMISAPFCLSLAIKIWELS